jgi:hypothetical protein
LNDVASIRSFEMHYSSFETGHAVGASECCIVLN